MLQDNETDAGIEPLADDPPKTPQFRKWTIIGDEAVLADVPSIEEIPSAFDTPLLQSPIQERDREDDDGWIEPNTGDLEGSDREAYWDMVQRDREDVSEQLLEKGLIEEIPLRERRVDERSLEEDPELQTLRDNQSRAAYYQEEFNRRTSGVDSHWWNKKRHAFRGDEADIKLQGKIIGETLPFVGGFQSSANQARYNELAEKIYQDQVNNTKIATEAEYQELALFNAIAFNRKHAGISGVVMEQGGKSLAWMTEMHPASKVGGSIGKLALAAMGSFGKKVAAKSAAAAAWTGNAASRGLASPHAPTVIRGLGTSLKTAGLAAPVQPIMAGHAFANAFSIQGGQARSVQFRTINGSIQAVKDDTIEDDNFLQAFSKGYGAAISESFSEGVGGALTLGLMPFASVGKGLARIAGKAGAKVAPKWAAQASSRVKDVWISKLLSKAAETGTRLTSKQVPEFAKRLGWNGILGEAFEERFNEVSSYYADRLITAVVGGSPSVHDMGITEHLIPALLNRFGIIGDSSTMSQAQLSAEKQFLAEAFLFPLMGTTFAAANKFGEAQSSEQAADDMVTNGYIGLFGTASELQNRWSLKPPHELSSEERYEIENQGVAWDETEDGQKSRISLAHRGVDEEINERIQDRYKELEGQFVWVMPDHAEIQLSAAEEVVEEIGDWIKTVGSKDGVRTPSRKQIEESPMWKALKEVVDNFGMTSEFRETVPPEDRDGMLRWNEKQRQAAFQAMASIYGIRKAALSAARDGLAKSNQAIDDAVNAIEGKELDHGVKKAEEDGYKGTLEIVEGSFVPHGDMTLEEIDELAAGIAHEDTVYQMTGYQAKYSDDAGVAREEFRKQHAKKIEAKRKEKAEWWANEVENNTEVLLAASWAPDSIVHALATELLKAPGERTLIHASRVREAELPETTDVRQAETPQDMPEQPELERYPEITSAIDSNPVQGSVLPILNSGNTTDAVAALTHLYDMAEGGNSKAKRTYNALVKKHESGKLTAAGQQAFEVFTSTYLNQNTPKVEEVARQKKEERQKEVDAKAKPTTDIPQTEDLPERRAFDPKDRPEDIQNEVDDLRRAQAKRVVEIHDPKAEFPVDDQGRPIVEEVEGDRLTTMQSVLQQVMADIGIAVVYVDMKFTGAAGVAWAGGNVMLLNADRTAQPDSLFKSLLHETVHLVGLKFDMFSAELQEELREFEKSFLDKVRDKDSTRGRGYAHYLDKDGNVLPDMRIRWEEEVIATYISTEISPSKIQEWMLGEDKGVWQKFIDMLAELFQKIKSALGGSDAAKELGIDEQLIQAVLDRAKAKKRGRVAGRAEIDESIVDQDQLRLWESSIPLPTQRDVFEQARSELEAAVRSGKKMPVDKDQYFQVVYLDAIKSSMQYLHKSGLLDSDITNFASFEKFYEILWADLHHALITQEGKKNFSGYYSRDWRKAKAALKKGFKELFGKDVEITQDDVVFFQVAAGLFSPQTNLEQNIKEALQALHLRKELGDKTFDDFIWTASDTDGVLSLAKNSDTVEQPFVPATSSNGNKMRTILMVHRLSQPELHKKLNDLIDSVEVRGPNYEFMSKEDVRAIQRAKGMNKVAKLLSTKMKSIGKKKGLGYLKWALSHLANEAQPDKSFIKNPNKDAKKYGVKVDTIAYANPDGIDLSVRIVTEEATGQRELVPVGMMFGEKVGPYVLNALGHREFTTTDIWEARLSRSLFDGMMSTTGVPVNVSETIFFQRLAKGFTTFVNNRIKEIVEKSEDNDTVTLWNNFHTVRGNLSPRQETYTGKQLKDMFTDKDGNVVQYENADLQAVRWFFFLNLSRRAGYLAARTEKTISGYTNDHLQKEADIFALSPTGSVPRGLTDTVSGGNESLVRGRREAVLRRGGSRKAPEALSEVIAHNAASDSQAERAVESDDLTNWEVQRRFRAKTSQSSNTILVRPRDSDDFRTRSRDDIRKQIGLTNSQISDDIVGQPYDFVHPQAWINTVKENNSKRRLVRHPDSSENVDDYKEHRIIMVVGSGGFAATAAVAKSGEISAITLPVSGPELSVTDILWMLDDVINASIAAGGIWIKVYDTDVSETFSNYGFSPAAKVSASEAGLPRGWDREANKPFHPEGEPDLLYMFFDGNRNPIGSKVMPKEYTDTENSALLAEAWGRAPGMGNWFRGAQRGELGLAAIQMIMNKGASPYVDVMDPYKTRSWKEAYDIELPQDVNVRLSYWHEIFRSPALQTEAGQPLQFNPRSGSEKSQASLLGSYTHGYHEVFLNLDHRVSKFEKIEVGTEESIFEREPVLDDVQMEDTLRHELIHAVIGAAEVQNEIDINKIFTDDIFAGLFGSTPRKQKKMKAALIKLTEEAYGKITHREDLELAYGAEFSRAVVQRMVYGDTSELLKDEDEYQKFAEAIDLFINEHLLPYAASPVLSDTFAQIAQILKMVDPVAQRSRSKITDRHDKAADAIEREITRAIEEKDTIDDLDAWSAYTQAYGETDAEQQESYPRKSPALSDTAPANLDNFVRSERRLYTAIWRAVQMHMRKNNFLGIHPRKELAVMKNYSKVLEVPVQEKDQKTTASKRNGFFTLPTSEFMLKPELAYAVHRFADIGVGQRVAYSNTSLYDPIVTLGQMSGAKVTTSTGPATVGSISNDKLIYRVDADATFFGSRLQQAFDHMNENPDVTHELIVVVDKKHWNERTKDDLNVDELSKDIRMFDSGKLLREVVTVGDFVLARFAKHTIDSPKPSKVVETSHKSVAAYVGSLEPSKPVVSSGELPDFMVDDENVPLRKNEVKLASGEVLSHQDVEGYMKQLAVNQDDDPILKHDKNFNYDHMEPSEGYPDSISSGISPDKRAKLTFNLSRRERQKDADEFAGKIDWWFSLFRTHAKLPMQQMPKVLERFMNYISSRKDDGVDYSVAKEMFRLMALGNRTAITDARKQLDAVMGGMSSEDHYDMSMYLVHLNAWSEYKERNTLHLGYKVPATLKLALDMWQTRVEKKQSILDALKRRSTLVRKIITKGVKVGLFEKKKWQRWQDINPDTGRPFYESWFHQEIYNAQMMRTADFMKGRKALESPLPEGEPTQRKQEYDYVTHYVASEYSWMTMALARINQMEGLQKINRHYGILNELKDLAKEKGLKESQWKQVMGEIKPGTKHTYRELYQVVNEEEALEEWLGANMDDAAAREVLMQLKDVKELDGLMGAVGVSRGRVMVLPNPIVQQLEFLKERARRARGDSDLPSMIRSGLKGWILQNPNNVIGYNIRNAIGDMDFTIAAQPKIIPYLKKALPLIRTYYLSKGKVTPPIFEEAHKLGAVDLSLIDHEVRAVFEIEEFSKYFKEVFQNEKVFKKMLRLGSIPYKKYMRFASRMAHMRENLYRLAGYMYFKENAEKIVTEMRGFSFGGTNAHKAKQVYTHLGRNEFAALMSRDHFGDYGNVTGFTQYWSSNIVMGMAFQKFTELIARRYFNLLNNAIRELLTGKWTATDVAAKSAVATLFGLKIGGVYIMAKLFNAWMTGGDDDDEALSRYDRAGVSLRFGTLPNGDALIFRNITASGELFDWLGATEFLNEENKTLGDKFYKASEHIVNKAWSGLYPHQKALFEAFFVRETHPDVFNPRDRGKGRAELVLQNLALGDVYRELMSHFGGGTRARPGSMTRAAADSLGALEAYFSGETGGEYSVVPYRVLGASNTRSNKYWAAKKLFDDLGADKKASGWSTSPTYPHFAVMRQSALEMDRSRFDRAMEAYQKRDKGTYESFITQVESLKVTDADLDEREKFFETLTNKQKEQVLEVEDFIHDVKREMHTWYLENLDSQTDKQFKDNETSHRRQKLGVEASHIGGATTKRWKSDENRWDKERRFRRLEQLRGSQSMDDYKSEVHESMKSSKSYENRKFEGKRSMNNRFRSRWREFEEFVEKIK